MNLAKPVSAGPRRAAAPLLALSVTLLAAPALAQTEAVATTPAPTAVADTPPPPLPSEVMAVNLIRLLVKQGVITQSAADAVVKEAEAEALQAKLASAQAAPLEVAPPPGVIRVPYVPQVVRDQIRDDIKKDVLAQAKSEGWASPGALPSWIGRIEWFGDFRFRDEFDLYDANNIAPYINYAAFNANGPTDINANTNPNGLPFLNTRNNRIDRLSLRARFGLNATVNDWVSATIRVATGSDNSPVSTTQLLGGGLTKKDIWLDQAYITLRPTDWGMLRLGRAPDPFVHTTLLFSDNLQFDGVSASASLPFGPDGLKVSATAGAFPLNYVSTNFPSDGALKTGERTSWLFAGQVGAEFKPDPSSWSASGAISYYDYYNVAGVLSAPCDLSQGNKFCSSDQSAPPFMQKGNTLFFIRDIIPNPNNPLNFPQPQLAGLSYDYRLIDVTGAFEMPLFGATRGQLMFDYVRNLAYDPARILGNPLTPPVTNFNCAAGPNSCVYSSGPNAWLVQAMIGDPHPSARGDWNLAVGYRYIEPDATLDAFTDENFHLGGTNAKGYYILGNYYFARNTWIGGRWYSSNQVFGPPLSIDVLQLEINTAF